MALAFSFGGTPRASASSKPSGSASGEFPVGGLSGGVTMGSSACDSALGRGRPINDPNGWMYVWIPCQGCGGRIPQLCGVICANFGFERGTGRVCYGAWHACCYKQLEKDKFPVLGITDVDDILMDDNRLEEEDPTRFKQARKNGDHLLCEFQCDCCQFENARGRRPDFEDPGDELAMLCIRRAILDAFWSRESSTVEMNRRLGVRYLEIQRKTGDRDNLRSYPVRGPFRVEDSAGMSLAITLLIRSLDRGYNANTIQYETMLKMRGHLSNFSHTCPGGMGDTFIGEEMGSTTVSNSVSNSVWF